MGFNRSTSSQIMKSINQQKVLRLIFTEGPISRVGLAQRTGLTQQTITNIVNRFLSKELVLELEPTPNLSGRKPIPLVINSKYMYAIGVEIAVKYVRGTLMNFQEEIIKEINVKVPVYKDEEQPMQYIYKVIDELLLHVPKKGDLKGIGCSIQGLVDTKKGEIIYSPGLRWRGFSLKEKLDQKYHYPIFLENDANLLALVENLNGSLRSSTHNIALKFDYGIGGAMIINKQLYAGSMHVAGEFGHYKAFTGKDAVLCHCGAEGCLTTFASISGVQRNSDFTIETYDAGVRANDHRAMALYSKVNIAIIRAVSNLITFFNPDHVLITGELVDRFGDLLIPALQKGIMETIPESCRDVKILHLTQTPNESILAGGLVMDRFFGVPLERLSLPIVGQE